MMNRKELKIDDIVQLLLNGGQSKIVVLFEDSMVKRRMGEVIGEKLRKDLNFVTNKVNKFKVTNNMIVVEGVTVYLGLKRDELLLLNNYSENEIVYYAG
jgi:hypothetical protein